MSTARGKSVDHRRTIDVVPPLFLSVQDSRLILSVYTTPKSGATRLIRCLRTTTKSTSPAKLIVTGSSSRRHTCVLCRRIGQVLSPYLLIAGGSKAAFPALVRGAERNSIRQILFSHVLTSIPYDNSKALHGGTAL